MTANTNTKVDLMSFKMDVLVSMVNALGGNVTMKTFSQRSKAVERINKLAAEKGINIEERFEADTGRWITDAEIEAKAEHARQQAAADAKAQAIIEEQAKEAKAPAEKPKKEKKVKEPKEVKPKQPSIRSVAEALILEVVGLDENKRKVGHSYETILAKIREQYPEAKTSIACLRWYAVHMRDRGVLPPSRPRAVPAKGEAEVSAQKPEA